MLQWIVGMAGTCLRWKHQGRAYFNAEDSIALCGWVGQGKRRVKGSRPGFEFAWPKLPGLPGGASSTGSFSQVYDQLAAVGVTHPWPAVILDVKVPQ